jgi:dTDP-glucose 4,6-dehydratase
VLEAGEPGGVYNIGGGFELSNLELARRICAFLGADESLISFVPDRPGHDFKYGLAWERLEKLGWRPASPFDDGLAITLSWYRDNRAWVETVLEGART